jgi:hypothetical protein
MSPAALLANGGPGQPRIRRTGVNRHLPEKPPETARPPPPGQAETSEAPLPLIDLCVVALKLRKEQQDADSERAGNAWIETGRDALKKLGQWLGS